MTDQDREEIRKMLEEFQKKWDKEHPVNPQIWPPQCPYPHYPPQPYYPQPQQFNPWSPVTWC